MSEEKDLTLQSGEEATTDNNSVAKSDAKDKTQPKLIDTVINYIANAISHMVRTSDEKVVRDDVVKIMATVMFINSVDEYDIGVRVSGEMYRFNDYKLPAAMANLIVGAKVTLSDAVTAKDFLDRNQFRPSMKPLTPSEMALACNRVASRLRKNPNYEVVSRSSMTLLTDAVKYAVTGRKIVDAAQNHIIFLTYKFDDEAQVDVKTWAEAISLKLFD